jgi:hypothetical protein
MNKNTLKSLNVRVLLCLGFLIFTAIIIHSCKKDNKNQLQDADITDPNVLVAQAWYNTSYPASAAASTGTAQATQSTGAQQASADWSKIISPYWSKATAFTSKKGLNIVEAPALKKGDMAFARNMPANLSKYDFSQSGSLTSMLILKQGKQHAAYAMTILGDSSYIKGDYSKLANNTYRKKDKDFTGWVLYHQLNGTFVNGWRYVNGKVTAAAHYNPGTATSTQAVQSVSTPQVNVLQTCDITIVWEIFSLCSYANSDVTLSSPQDCTYTARFVGAYSTCSDVPATDPSGGTQTAPAPPTPPCVPQSGGSAAPAAVNSKTTLALKANKQTVLVAQPTDPPPTDPNGEIVPVLLCPVTVTTIDTAATDTLNKIVKNFCDNVSASQRQEIINALYLFKAENCVQKGIFNNFYTSKIGITFCISNSLDNNGHPIAGGADVSNIAITFQDGMVESTMDEELYHLYQNKVYIGGTGQYGTNGRTDIEFEAKLFNDIANPPGTAGALYRSQLHVDAAYGGDENAYNNDVIAYRVWLNTITKGGTYYPKSMSDVDQNQYNHFLGIFANLYPEYGPAIQLTPQAIFNSFSLYGCK